MSGWISSTGWNINLASPGPIGNVTPSTGKFTTLTATQNVVIDTAGNGIDFSAVTPAPGMTSQVLTDYERGTWTPSIGGDATYLLQEGYYVKVGNLVFVQGKIQINTIGTGSTTDIQGLPFVSFASILASGGTGGVAYFSNLLSSVTSITPLIAASSTSLYFGSLASAASTSTGVTPVFQDNTRIDFSLTYISAN